MSVSVQRKNNQKDYKANIRTKEAIMTDMKKTSPDDSQCMDIEEILELFLVKLKELDQRLDKLENHANVEYLPSCAEVS